MDGVISFLKIAVAIVTSLVILVFIGLIVVAQIGCPIQKCTGPDGDIWMMPLFFSIAGIPAALILAALIVFNRRR